MTESLSKLFTSVKFQAILLLSGMVIALLFHLKWLGFQPRFIIPDLLSLFLVSLACIGLLNTIQRYFNSNRAFNFSNTALLILVIGIISSSNFFISGLFAGWNSSYIEYLRSMLPYRLITLTLFFFFIHIRLWSTTRIEKEEKMKQIAIENERALVNIEMNSIQQQLKPHFLFNSLNSINALTMTNPQEAQKMVQLLSEFMRGSVQQDQNVIVPLKEELHHLKLYTDIEKVRFGDRLNVAYMINEDAMECTLPFLILQPIIENAIKYGLYGNTGNITIEISAIKENDLLAITVTNPFDLITQQTNKGTGYGIRSVNRKLLLLYKRSNLLKTSAKNSIFTVSLQIPQS